MDSNVAAGCTPDSVVDTNVEMFDWRAAFVFALVAFPVSRRGEYREAETSFSAFAPVSHITQSSKATFWIS